MVADAGKPNHYFEKIDECLLMAKTATSNKTRAQFYASADYYLRLADAESSKRFPSFESQSS
jgi:hypothetical protein